MKMLKIKIGKRRMFKWAVYLLAAYLLASWGVNGVVNPMHYFNRAQRNMLHVEKKEDGLVIELPADSKSGSSYLSFWVTQAKEYSSRLKLSGYPAQGGMQEMEIPLWKGWNVAELGAYEWDHILIRKDEMEQKELVIEEVGWSARRIPDTERMLSVFVSFVLMAAFWECVCWVKDRYAK